MIILSLFVACFGSSYNCFVEGTRITMDNGLTKNIEDVRIGDAVLSYDVQEDLFVDRGVIDLHKYSSTELFTIKTTSSFFEGVTAEHPFYQPDTNSWIPVDELREGDQILISQDGQTHLDYILDVEAKRLRRPVDVYNLSVEGPEHNYFANGVLVHNKTKEYLEEPYQVTFTNLSEGTTYPASNTQLYTIDAEVRIDYFVMNAISEDLTIQVVWSFEWESGPQATDCGSEIVLTPNSETEIVAVQCEHLFYTSSFDSALPNEAVSEQLTITLSGIGENNSELFSESSTIIVEHSVPDTENTEEE